MAVIINVVGNFDDKEIKRAEREIAKLSGNTKKHSSNFKGSMGGMTKSLVGVAAGVFALNEVKNAFITMAKEAAEAQSITKTTDAIIKSTGGAANVSAKQIEELSTALSNKTGIDDELIQSGSNLLLTFKNVRNEAGAGANIFDRANTAALDLSKAGFGSVTGAAKMLGKALNDPLKGMTGLSKAGVTFSDQQKAQIKTLMASGKTLQAQQLIMQEVESQVGGVAEAAASPIERLQTMFGNFMETIGTTLLPIINQVVTAIGPILETLAGPLSEVVSTVANVLSKAFEQLAPLIGPIATALATVAEVVGNVLSTALEGLLPTLMPILTMFADLINKVGPILQPLLQQVAVLFSKLVAAIAPLIPPLIQVIEQLFTNAAPILDMVIKAMIQLVDVFIPLVPVIASLIPPLGEFVNTLLVAIAPIIQPLLPLIVSLAKLFGETMVLAIGGAMIAFGGLFKALSPMAGWLLNNVLTPVANMLLSFIDTVLSGVATAFGWLPGIGDDLQNASKEFSKFSETTQKSLDGLGDTVSGAGSKLGDQLLQAGKDTLTKAGQSTKAQTKAVCLDIAAGVQDNTKVLKESGQLIGDSVTAGVKDSAGNAAKAGSDLAKAATDAATKVLQKYKDKAQAFLDFKLEITKSLRDFGSVQQFGAGAGDFFPNAQGIIGGLQDKLRRIKEFGTQLVDLKSMGLNNSSLQQILAAGPEAGGSIAAALLAEGQKAIGEVNVLESQINLAAAGVGTTGAESQFGMNAGNAAGLQQTNFNFKDGAIQVTVGAGTSATDKAEIKKAVQTAVAQAIKEAKQQAGR